MNYYNSVNEIFSASVGSMTSSNKLDWFVFNNKTIPSIYTDMNPLRHSFSGTTDYANALQVGFLSASKSIYKYYEEGILYNYYKFFRMRHKMSLSSTTTSKYIYEYDLILWDTGDISLHVVTFPTSSAPKAEYCVLKQNDIEYPYTISTTSPDVTFVKSGDEFVVQQSTIELELPCERRYLIKDDYKYYTIVDNALLEVAVSELTSSVFLTSGFKNLTSISVLLELTNPELLCWAETEKFVSRSITVRGTPVLPHVVYYDPIEIPEGKCIDNIGFKYDLLEDTIITVTSDNGQTWKYYNGDVWVTTNDPTVGMTVDMFQYINWQEAIDSNSIQVRLALLTTNAAADYKIYYNLVDITTTEE